MQFTRNWHRIRRESVHILEKDDSVMEICVIWESSFDKINVSNERGKVDDYINALFDDTPLPPEPFDELE